MVTIIGVAVIVLIIAPAAFYVVREKKKGRKCIGCPYAGKEGCSCSR